MNRALSGVDGRLELLHLSVHVNAIILTSGQVPRLFASCARAQIYGGILAWGSDLFFKKSARADSRGGILAWVGQ